MSTLRILSLALSATVCFVAASRAAPITLNVNPGLWQVTSTGEVSGAPPIPQEQLAKLSPAQRAKVAAAMAAAMGSANKPIVFKQCVTAESLQRGFEPDPKMGPNSCTETVVSSTPTAMDLQIECTGPQKASGTVHFEAATPAAFAGKVDITVTDGSHTMKVSRTLQGEWQGADCGNVKPSGG